MDIPLEMQVNKTQAGLYTVTYGCIEASLGNQELAFAANNLIMVSPAQLGFLRAQEGRGTFESYSKTNADVFYDDRSKLAVIVPNGVISRIVGLADFISDYMRDGEYIVLKNQRDLVYDVVDEMLRKGTAFTANRGRTDVNTSEFGQTELTSRLFSDEGLGIRAQDYGDWLKDRGIKTQSIFFNCRSSADIPKTHAETLNASYLNKAPYWDRLRVYGPGGGFDVYGYYGFLHGSSGTFGVRFDKNQA